MSDIVIDASCVLSFLLNQDGSENVVSIVGMNKLVAPSCLPFEIGNAISKLIKRKIISVEKKSTLSYIKKRIRNLL